MTQLKAAIDTAVRGGFPEGTSPLDGHDFYIRSVKNKNLLQSGETSYFRHDHVGQDDRVFYSIQLGPNRGDYTAKLTRIQFRGPFVKNGFRDIGKTGIDVSQAVKVLTAAAGLNWLPTSWAEFAAAVTELDVQGFLDGNWVPAAAKVVDMIGARMAQDLPLAPDVSRRTVHSTSSGVVD